MTTTRPLSVTIIGWFLVVTTVTSLPMTIRSSSRRAFEKVAATRSVPVAVQQTVSIAAALANLIGGYFLLRGKNWARYLVVAWSLAMLGYGFFVSPYRVPLLFGLPMTLLGGYFLFRRPASEFLEAVRAGAAIDNELTWRRIASNCFYIATAVFLSGSSLIAFMNSAAFKTSPELASLPWKWFILSIASVIPLVSLAIGQVISDGRSRMRELGIVLLASAAGGTMMVLTMFLFSFEPTWQDTLPAEKRWSITDYWNGIIWLGLLGSMGAVALFAGLGTGTVRSTSTRPRGVPRR